MDINHRCQIEKKETLKQENVKCGCELSKTRAVKYPLKKKQEGSLFSQKIQIIQIMWNLFSASMLHQPFQIEVPSLGKQKFGIMFDTVKATECNA